MVCCFTGHRKIASEELARLPLLLERTLERLIREGVTVFRAGGAIGFDTLAALSVLEKKETYSQIRLELILPCKDQADRWSAKSREIYEYILRSADSVTVLRERYTAGCMQERNRRLVEGAHRCVAFCRNGEGGSAYTVAYAKRNGVSVINLAEQIH